MNSKKVAVYCCLSPALHRHLLTCPYTILYSLNLAQLQSSLQTAIIRGKRYSTLSVQWLTNVAKTENSQICHMLQDDEYQVGSYFLDGHAAIDRVPRAFYFNRHFFHHCIECYQENDWKSLVKASFECVCYTTQQNVDHLKRVSFNIRPKQMHEWVTLTVTGEG